MNIFSQSIVLIPCLNEKENLRSLLPLIFESMPGISVLISDDNSSDGTPELLNEMKKIFPNLFILKRIDNFGYGRASIDGFRWIQGGLINF